MLFGKLLWLCFERFAISELVEIRKVKLFNGVVFVVEIVNR